MARPMKFGQPMPRPIRLLQCGPSLAVIKRTCTRIQLSMSSDPTLLILMYFIVPIWLAAGFADWLCHRAAGISVTSGPKESLIHLLMFAEVGIPMLATIFLQVNAGIILVMIVAFAMHEATALWDVSYAVTTRKVTPLEQHVHSFLEMVPLMAMVLVVSLHWAQFAALFGAGPERARFDLEFKVRPLPFSYVALLLTAIVLLELLPYLEELMRGVSRRATAAREQRRLAGGSHRRLTPLERR
jgi:hypothetical protein